MHSKTSIFLKQHENKSTFHNQTHSPAEQMKPTKGTHQIPPLMQTD